MARISLRWKVQDSVEQSKELLKHCACLLGSTMIARPTRQSLPLGSHQYVAVGFKNASRVHLLAISGPSVRSGPDFRYNRENGL